MEGTPVTYKEFTVYPEYCELPLEELRDNSFDGNYHTATLPISGYNMMVIYNKGERIYSRPKYRLHNQETEQVIPGEGLPKVIKTGSISILPLICYELLFPEDYLKLYLSPKVIIHMVGFPMYDENQKEGWVAMQ